METNKLINEMQAENQRLQAVLIQKQSLKMQETEVGNALKHLKDCSDDVYKSIGPILVKGKKEDIKKELEDSNEEIKLKLVSLDKQEKRLREKIQSIQENLQTSGQGG